MKKLYSTIMMLAMMVATLSLTACGGSDENELVGEWIVKMETDSSNPTHISFKSDGTYVETKSSDEIQGEWNLSGSVLSLKNSLATFEYDIIEKEKGKMKVQMKGMGMTFFFEKVNNQ
jgi:major membrane immunogen (membrane-anchored lipoprotein)